MTLAIIITILLFVLLNFISYLNLKTKGNFKNTEICNFCKNDICKINLNNDFDD